MGSYPVESLLDVTALLSVPPITLEICHAQSENPAENPFGFTTLLQP